MADQVGAPRPDVTDMYAVHGVFRDTLGAVPRLVGDIAAGDAARVDQLANYYDNILFFLESHHDGEEKIVFPRLRERCPQEEALLDSLESEHEAALSLLADARTSLAAWPGAGADGGAAAQAAVVDSLEVLRTQLVRHLDEEETRALPLCAENMSAEEWGQLPGHALAGYQGDKVWLIQGLIRQRMTDAQRAAMLEHMPPPARDMWTGFGETAFNELSAEVLVDIGREDGRRLAAGGRRSATARPGGSVGPVTNGSTGEPEYDSEFSDPDLVEDFDLEQAFGAAAGGADARQAGDEGVEGLDKITAQMPGGEHRPEQQEMCRAVAEALATGTHLVVQAGTGTGKSLAYLVPAALSGKKVVVATATKALQNQLAEKDLPLLESGLGLPVPLDIAVLKGRSNYICRQRVAEVGSGGIQAELGDQAQGRADEPDWEPPEVGAGAGRTTAPGASPPEGMVEEVRQLVAWSQTARTGDRADLSFEPSDRAWNMLSVGPRECPGAFNCPSGGSCFAEAARDRAAAADIVVVNTHLYGAHLASGGVVLPEHEVVVFDEAHELEEVMTASLGVELSPGRFRTLVTAARSLVEDGDADLLDSLAAVGDLLGTLLADRVGTRVLLEGPRATADDTDLSELLARGADVSRRAVNALRRSGAQRSFISSDAEEPDRASRKTRTLQAAAHLAEDLHRLVGRTDAEVAWVDGTRRNPRLRLSPIDVGPALAGMLWGSITSVLTSATIPPRVVERVGLDDFPTEELNVGSPFDYRAHALLYVARHLPDRRTEGAEEAVFEELALLIEAAGGRTLALFTSRRATEAAAEALAPELPYTVLLQGDLPKGRLLEEFAADETSCLFATLGFWQGVDIPGRALSLVTIDRLPFPRPDDPLLQARRDRAGSRAFSMVDLPRAATLLAQGSGRLIRTADDKGVVAVLDPRLATASYRGVLLATLPPMRRSVDRAEVESFLRRALDEDGAET